MTRKLFLLAAAVLVFTNAAPAASADGAPPQPDQLPSAPGHPSVESGFISLPDSLSAPPLTTTGKFDTRIRQTIGIRGVVGAAIGATFGQVSGVPREWGGGVEGYTKRYASSFGGNVTRQSFAFVLEPAFREDPRYFPSESLVFRDRLINSVKQTFLCKTDSGRTSFGYGKVISAFGSGRLINTWQPNSTSSVANGFKRGTISLGGDFAYNFLQEFFPFTRPKSIRQRP